VPEGAERFDVVIVGAGSAGCVLASRLSEDRGRRVLLLEAGPPDRHPYVKIPAAFPKLFGSRLDWGERSEPQEALGGRRVYLPRGRLLGGSSSINAMMWVRGLPADYAAWEELAGPGWGWPDALAYFRRIEDTAAPLAAADPGQHGRGGPLSISPPRQLNPLTSAWLEAARTLGMPLLEQNGAASHGVAPAALSQRHGRRHSAADAYLRPALRRTNLTVRTGMLVDRVLVADGRAVGVAYRRGGREAIAAADEVVLAAGTVGSPALLQRSGIGPAPLLRRLGIEVVADVAGVGAGLADHLASGVVVESRLPLTLAAAERPVELWRFVTRRRGLLTSNVAEGYGYLRSDPALSLPDLEVIFAPVAFLEEGLVVPKEHGLTLAAVLLTPESRGSVAITAPDPAAAPAIDPRYLSDPAGADAARLSAGVRWCLRVLTCEPLASLAGRRLLPAGELADDEVVVAASLRDNAQTLYHPVGTCAMGSAATSVVDPELRLRAVAGLRVVDASAIPRLVRGHTNAATMMLAEKASDLMRRLPAPQVSPGQ